MQGRTWYTVHERLDELVLDRTRAHVWVCDLDERYGLNLDHSLLSSDETDRARRLQSQLQRQRFVQSRAVLRHVLGAILNIRPQDVALSSSPQGKPFVQPTNGGAHLHFNSSRSENVFALGVAFDSQIGVDAEVVRSSVDALGVARSHFLQTEVAYLKALRSGERLRAFYKYWTAKEAFLKAVGLRISSALTQVNVCMKSNGEVFIRDMRLLADRDCTLKLWQRDFQVGISLATVAIVITV